MATVKLIRGFERKVVKITGLLGCIIAASLILALSSQVEAGSPVLGSADIPANFSPLAAQTARLDKQLAAVESRLHTLRP